MIPGWIHQYSRTKLGADLAAVGRIVTYWLFRSVGAVLLAGCCRFVCQHFPGHRLHALLGSSMAQAVGPAAITAIMTYSVLSPWPAPVRPNTLFWLRHFRSCPGHAAGLRCIAPGFLSQLLSRPVISGFISGSAVLIMISQMKYLLGVSVHGSNSSEVVLDLLGKLADSHLPTLKRAGCFGFADFCARRAE